MNQNDTRAALEAAARSTYNAYWDVVKGAALKQQLLDLFGNISDVSTKLNQEWGALGRRPRVTGPLVYTFGLKFICMLSALHLHQGGLCPARRV